MESIQQIVDGKLLSQIIPLPESLRSIFVKITVMPAVESAKPMITRSKLRKQLQGSHTESLSGVLQPQKDITLEELRAERRTKYERID